MDTLIVIIVLNWNLPAETAACVTSLLTSNHSRQRILVVDNGSTDESVLQLQHRFGDAIDVLETGANLFYAGGNNVGIQWALDAGADFVLILNNDTLVAPDMVSRLVQTALACPKVGILSPMIYFGHERTRIWALGSRRHRWWPMPRDVGRGELDHGQYTTPIPVDYVTGCAMLVRRAVFTQVGLFDSNYRMYYEDADLCARARQAGFGLLVEPRAKLWHMVSASAELEAATSYYQRTRYRIQFYRHHPHGPFPWLTLALLWLQGMFRVGLMLICGQLDLASAGWRGLWDGYMERDAHEKFVSGP